MFENENEFPWFLIRFRDDVEMSFPWFLSREDVVPLEPQPYVHLSYPDKRE